MNALLIKDLNLHFMEIKFSIRDKSTKFFAMPGFMPSPHFGFLPILFELSMIVLM